MALESVREILRRRDSMSDTEIDELFDEARCDWESVLQDGTDPEEWFQDMFELEPDYLFDPELGLM